MSLGSRWNFLKKHTPASTITDGSLSAPSSGTQPSGAADANGDFQATEFIGNDADSTWSDTVIAQEYIDTLPAALSPH
jgi:hypothetical protein